jgi:hypothetical protein
MALFNRQLNSSQLQPRLGEVTINNGLVTFHAKLSLPNDTKCSKQWHTPTHFTGTLPIHWMIVEKGGYLVNGTQIVVGKATISGYSTKVDWAYTFGTACHYPAQATDDDYTPGAITELQTNYNNDFLVTRSSLWWFKGEENMCSYAWQTGRFFLEPHDGQTVEYQYNLHTEDMGYLLFDSKPHIVDCLGSASLEFIQLSAVTHSPIVLPIISPHSSSSTIGVFGATVGYHGGDSIVPMSYLSDSTPYVYLQVHR